MLRKQLLRTLDGGRTNDDLSVKSIANSKISMGSRYSRFEPVKITQEVKNDGRT